MTPYAGESRRRAGQILRYNVSESEQKTRLSPTLLATYVVPTAVLAAQTAAARPHQSAPSSE